MPTLRALRARSAPPGSVAGAIARLRRGALLVADDLGKTSWRVAPGS